DATGTIAMSATGAKVALVTNTTTLTGSCPTTALDFVGYDGANCFEGSGATATLSNTTAALRKSGGCIDTNANANDFVTGSPNPRNTASPLNVCGADQAPTVSSTSPANNANGVSVNSSVSITLSEPVDVTDGWYDISCGTSGGHTASVSGGPTTFTLDPATDFAANETCTVTVHAATVSVGDALRVRGRVQEFRPGGSSTGNLTTTELSGSPSITVLSSGNPLPPATVVGTGGRVPPDQVIEDDAGGSVETSGTFDPANDGLDFWETLEGMRVQLDNAVAVGPTNAFGETPAIGDKGANASVLTNRGGS